MNSSVSIRRSVLVIVGMHNSGTSLVANIAHVLGADLGPRVLTRDSYAPGQKPRYDYWEHALITDTHDRLMAALGRHWRTSTAADPIAPSVWRTPVVEPFYAELRAAVVQDLAETRGLWGFKDPRTVRLLPLWRRLFDDLGLAPRYLVCTRAPGAVGRSFARKAQVPVSWAESLWACHSLESLQETEGAPRLIVDYADWFRAPEATLDSLIAFLGVHVSAPQRAEALALIDPGVSEVRGAPEPRIPLCREIETLLARTAAGQAGAGEADALRVRLDAPRPSAAVPGVDTPCLDADRTEVLPDPTRRRVALVTMEFPGLGPGGGIGTAFGALAGALREAGHAVTVVHAGPRGEAFDATVAALAGQGIVVESLPWTGVPAAMSQAVLDHLRGRVFDVVHVHDWVGLGGLLALAHHAGEVLAGATLVCGVHGPTAWAASANGQADLIDSGLLEADGLERLTIAKADVLVAPSGHVLDWLRARGWPLPARCFVQQNVYPQEERRADGQGEAQPSGVEAPSVSAGPAPIREVVFFGRLEARKGVIVFVEALERLAADGVPLPKVTFLGPNTATVEGDAIAWARGRLAPLGIEPRHEARLDRAGALAYLRGPGRLAVMPSRLENSPYVVLEAVLEGVPFLASAAGGTPELIAAADREPVLFTPTVEGLAGCLRAALTAPPTVVSVAVDPAATRRAWQAWHERVPVVGAAVDEPAASSAVPGVGVGAGATSTGPKGAVGTTAKGLVDPRLAALLASTSWRVSAPVRRLLGSERPRSADEIQTSLWWDLAAPLRIGARLVAILRRR